MYKIVKHSKVDHFAIKKPNGSYLRDALGDLVIIGKLQTIRAIVIELNAALDSGAKAERDLDDSMFDTFMSKNRPRPKTHSIFDDILGSRRI